MMRKLLYLFLTIFILSSMGCAREITEEELKQFVIEYDDALSKGWSESDEIFVPWVTNKYLWKYAFLDHCTNKYWFIYGDNIEIMDIEKVSEDDYELYGKNSYEITYRQKVIYEVRDKTLNQIENTENYGRKKVFVAPKNGKLYVTSYGYTSFWVKQKHSEALIKRKGLVYAE